MVALALVLSTQSREPRARVTKWVISLSAADRIAAAVKRDRRRPGRDD